MATLTEDELARIRAEVLDNVLDAGATAYFDVRGIYDVIRTNVVSSSVSATTSTTTVSSAGPTTLALVGTALEQGRVKALILASGVTCGSLTWSIAAALGLLALATARTLPHWFAAWGLLGLAMRMTLYDACFAALVRIDPAGARRASPSGRPAIRRRTRRRWRRGRRRASPW